MQFAAFPQGQFVAVCGNRIVGYATSLIVNIDDEFWYDVDELTGAGTFSTHNPDGDTLYGADIAVHPDFRRRGVATLLYKRRRSLLKRNNLRRMIAYGRIPGYKEHGRILKMEPRDIDHEFPGGRARVGSGMPPQTPVKNLYNVGDAVLSFGLAGATGAADSARRVAEIIQKSLR